MKTVNGPAAVLALLIAHGTAWAQTPLQVDEVLSSVERFSPLMRAAELEEPLAAADTLSAEGAFDLSWKTRATATPGAYYESLRVDSLLEKPTNLWGLNVFAGWRAGWGDYATYDGKLQTLEGGEFRAGLSLPLWRNGPIDRRRSSESRARLGQTIATQTVQQQRLELRRAAALRYWAWVAADRRRQLAAQMLATAVARDSGLAQRVRGGDLPEYERLDNQRALEQRRAQLALAERGLQQSAIELSLYFRSPAGAPIKPTADQVPQELQLREIELQLDADLALAMKQRPEVLRLQAVADQASIEQRYAENQRAPAIDLMAQAAQDVGRPLEARKDLTSPTFELGLSIDVPLQTRVMQGRVQAAQALAQRATFQLQFARDRIEAEIRDAHSAIQAARSRLVATRAEAQVARKLEEGERIRFEQGEGHLLIVNLREQQTMEAELRVIDAWLDERRGEVERSFALADLSGA